MKAEIITIGDEILIGQILDTNSKWIAEKLNSIGVSVYQVTSIQDEKEHILKAIREAEQNADIVVITGGLGPTKDDITKHTITTYFEDTLVMNEDISHHIQQMFAKINYPFTELNRQQAMVPSKCIPLQNNRGTAPGMWFDHKGKVFVSLPGVPHEMKGLMIAEVLPKLKSKFNLPVIVHKTVLTYGMGESMVAERLETWENELPEFIKLAYLPSFGAVRLRLSAKGEDKVALEESVDKEVKKLNAIIGDILVGFDEEETLEVVVGKLLSHNKQTISVAESCTGGNIAHMLTSVAGASAYFKGAIVSYTAAIKKEQLNVSEAVIAENSVVSAAVAEAMAVGVQKKMETDYAIATTGNAGPTTDDTDKTVGVVFIAIASSSGVYSEEFYFGQPREKVIQRSSIKALELLKKEIEKNNSNSL